MQTGTTPVRRIATERASDGSAPTTGTCRATRGGEGPTADGGDPTAGGDRRTGVDA